MRNSVKREPAQWDAWRSVDREATINLPQVPVYIYFM